MSKASQFNFIIILSAQWPVEWHAYLDPKLEAVSRHSKETALVIYLAFLAKVANLDYMVLTAFKKYWQDTAAKFISGTQDTFI